MAHLEKLLYSSLGSGLGVCIWISFLDLSVCSAGAATRTAATMKFPPSIYFCMLCHHCCCWPWCCYRRSRWFRYILPIYFIVSHWCVECLIFILNNVNSLNLNAVTEMDVLKFWQAVVSDWFFIFERILFSRCTFCCLVFPASEAVKLETDWVTARPFLLLEKIAMS